MPVSIFNYAEVGDLEVWFVKPGSYEPSEKYAFEDPVDPNLMVAYNSKGYIIALTISPSDCLASSQPTTEVMGDSIGTVSFSKEVCDGAVRTADPRVSIVRRPTDGKWVSITVDLANGPTEEVIKMWGWPIQAANCNK